MTTVHRQSDAITQLTSHIQFQYTKYTLGLCEEKCFLLQLRLLVMREHC